MERFGLKDEVINFIIDKAQELQMTKVVLFGSRARNAYSDKSDIDLAIEGAALHEYEEALEENCPTLLSFDLIDTSQDLSAELTQRILEEGVVLYEIR